MAAVAPEKNERDPRIEGGGRTRRRVWSRPTLGILHQTGPVRRAPSCLFRLKVPRPFFGSDRIRTEALILCFDVFTRTAMHFARKRSIERDHFKLNRIALILFRYCA
jgi:hypothetical protein